MHPFSRRGFLGAVTAAGIAALTGTTAAARPTTPQTPHRTPDPLARHRAPGHTDPHATEDHRVLVVGSGSRRNRRAPTAEAGVPVVVVERGAAGPPAERGHLPQRGDPRRTRTVVPLLPEVFGRPRPPRHTGLLEASVGENMTSVCATGVGGGSLIYQGMALQPTEELFHTWFPGAIDWRRMADEYYPRVARMLRLAQAPDELIDSPTYAASRVFARRVRDAGLPLRKIPMPIDWNYALAELRGEMRPAYTNGDSSLGVNNGGKHTVDVTYLARAEATGLVDVRPLHDVRALHRLPDGRWELDVEVLDTAGHLLRTLTLRAPASSWPPDPSAPPPCSPARRHRRRHRPARRRRRGLGHQRRPHLPVDRPHRRLRGRPGRPGGLRSLNWDHPRTAHTLIQASLPPFGADAHTTVMVGYGVTPTAAASSTTRSGSRSHPLARRRRRRHPARHIDPTARRIVGPTGHLTDTNRMLNSTWHPLGGAAMGSVCDLDGRVLGQRGLYVVDGALIPGTTAACNPSWTIAAIAERALDRIARHDVGTVF